MEIRPNGTQFFSQHVSTEDQNLLLEDVRARIPDAPLYTPTMPRTGKSMSVRMTNFGAAGWMSDAKGYRYQRAHPETGSPWPDIPQSILDIWTGLLPDAPLPDVCLCNYYPADAKMGLHQDRDEQDLTIPVLSISLGDTALFRLGQTTRGGKTQSFKLRSGDVMILRGSDRLAYHGIDRIYPGTSSLLKQGGRINLTLRKAL
ncbi:alpha-ketoglutarate-dependent dioxygenase AlkB [Ponticaulis sp.]|uniref:alpha-ketoglutarate-dependent dioxygenase AlkB n=1 Tax=Ponticaulis sp. TaxID=2020902 RepID=UPI000B72DFD3|nr:alpha-ketoglutarate-dependent dioxygenase AlkB [Ponticaulis sp.]MAJ09511.1 alkylated DNA repair dioxygenase [Ponticaulis sp.]RPG18855.1 MAG: alpha-ketoglutarate-dependent dioxygenase AlkB [Hyphomonadaceae bacterium TMED125]HBH91357.1 alkylated DNA repair dioxygenase [Hyphomonadaceae bacterium]|tara:strand:+ start:8989 stop:9594 length:606 start_codon:yes stop_codon:yes gene_type:complete